MFALQSSAAVQAILARPQVQHPKYVNDRNHFLSEYLISSSHNTVSSSLVAVGSSAMCLLNHSSFSLAVSRWQAAVW